MLLSQQNRLLNSFFEPTPISSSYPVSHVGMDPYEAEIWRRKQQKGSIVDMVKGRWNEELTAAVHNVQGVDWTEAGKSWANRAGALWRKMSAE